MKKKFSAKDLLFLIEALNWAERDQGSLAAYWGWKGKAANDAKRSMLKCKALGLAINDFLKSGGKGISFSMDDMIEGSEALTLSDIKEGLKSGEFVIDDDLLTRAKKDER